MSFLLVLLGKILILMEFYLQGLHKFYHFGSKNRYWEKKRRNMVTKKKERNSVDEIYLRFDGAHARPGCSFVETTTNEQHWPEGSSRQRHQLR